MATVELPRLTRTGQRVGRLIGTKRTENVRKKQAIFENANKKPSVWWAGSLLHAFSPPARGGRGEKIGTARSHQARGGLPPEGGVPGSDVLLTLPSPPWAGLPGVGG